MQYPLRPEEGSNPPELKLSGPPAEQSVLLTAEQALESRDVYFRHLDSLDQGGLWVCWGCLDHINLMREDSSTVGGTIPCV